MRRENRDKTTIRKKINLLIFCFTKREKND